MGIELPPELAQIATALNVRWPQADEDKMREAAKAWRTAGDGVTRLSTETDAVAQHALTGAKGRAADGARRQWNGFVAADHGRMPLTAKGCLEAAQRLEHAAGQIEATKSKIVAELVKLAKQDDVAQLLAQEGGREALASRSSLAAGVLANLTQLTDALETAVRSTSGVSMDNDVHPVTGPGAVDPSTGYPIDPATGMPMDPKTGRLIDPDTGNLVGQAGNYMRDPQTGQLIDLRTNQPVDAGTLPQYDPVTGEPIGGAGSPSGAPPPAAAPGTQPPLPPDPRQPELPVRAGDHEQPSFGPQPGKGAPPPYYDPSPQTGPIELPRQQPAPPPPVYYDPTPTPPMRQGPGPNEVRLSFAGAPEPVAGPPAAPPPVAPPPVAPAAPPPSFQQFGPGQPGTPFAPPPAAPPPAAPPVAAPGHAAAAAPHAPAGAGAAAGGAAGVAPVPVHGGRGGVGMDAGFGPNKDWRGVRPGAGYLEMAPGVAPVVEPDRPVAPAKLSLPARKDDELALFLVHLFPLGHMPRPTNRPARQLPRPRAELDYAAGLRFPPHDHPRSELITGYPVAQVPRTPGLAPDHPAVLALVPAYDPLGGQHEREWDRRFLARPATEDRAAEYAWPPAELCPEGGVDPDGAEPIVLSVGSMLDRFGPRDGRVFAVDGTPFAERGLPPELIGHGYHRFRVARELPVWRTVAAPWFGQAGGGIRFRTTHAAAELVALGFLVEVGEDTNA
ncbi:glycohydrolase toxin TNT-related protein [Crossiella sp. CA-258035]|uniref:glycohydrolase toxin TNT-related protein n=1 Tax=Crossiella sp. CA-258035 TaxID=2981138 RepID=UPI0024BD4B00|nr:glycohydrolase toxin TNT-related protein [Crossiella sp. CA-258035]WHT20347.1 glycohydrolase toxin TNT-related protein [Crossiella sp. CA-258035]